MTHAKERERERSSDGGFANANQAAPLVLRPHPPPRSATLMPRLVPASGSALQANPSLVLSYCTALYICTDRMRSADAALVVVAFCSECTAHTSLCNHRNSSPRLMDKGCARCLLPFFLGSAPIVPRLYRGLSIRSSATVRTGLGWAEQTSFEVRWKKGHRRVAVHQTLKRARS